MRYTVRQQHCLQAMGIVPWVSRLPEDAATQETVVSGPQPGEAARAGVSDHAPPSCAQPPSDVENLGEWLLEQALVPIELRGGLHPVLGAADASLLVVVALDTPSPVAGSMAGDDGRLFELMLRSVSLNNRDTRRCQVASRPGEAAQAGSDAVSQAGVSALCTARTRGVLVLMNPWPFEKSNTAVEQHQSRLPGSGLPLWRIAHPSILLEQPQFKRQAWQVLKRLRAVLDGEVL